MRMHKLRLHICMHLFILLFLLNSIYCDIVSIPSNCIGLSDGYYYLKLLQDDNYPIIYTKCSNEYLILDPSLDKDIQLYFNSFEMYHISVAGPSNKYLTNWDNWFIPTSNHYLISPNCDSCDIDHTRQLYSSQTVYMMTGTMFGCYWLFHNNHKYDQDWNTYECYYDKEDTSINNIKQQVGDYIKYPLTDTSTKYDWDHSGLCAFNVRYSNMQIQNINHESCTIDDIYNGYHLKPSIGTNGKHCICTQPIDNNNIIHVNSNALKQKQIEIQNMHDHESNVENIINHDEEQQGSSEAEIIYYLYQNDFEYGTYRISKSGRYVLMEDIIFNPNAPQSITEHINDDMNAWRPHDEQQQQYPGANEYKNPYFMGFWAAITIETNDVILDLNDHTIAMDTVFYYQQRWFTIISLTSQYYLPGQGIGFFGAEPKFASNVVIKDGTLGLTSHHCIHGNFNTNILIEHITCRDFETHGIQLNGFDHITIRNVEIGPTSNIAYLRGEYGHARALLPRLKLVADENPDNTIQFYGRDHAVNMNELLDELIRQMDLIFDYIYNGIEPKGINDWNDILDLFYNPSGLPNGASVYGIYLNTVGENTMRYNLNTNTFSSHAILNNINIHDMRHNMIEYIRVNSKTQNPFGSTYVNPLQAPYDAAQMFVELDMNNLRYKGNIMTDILFALSEFTDNWDYLQNQLIFKSNTLPWAKGEDIYALDNNIEIGCNNDVMLQSGKGLMGIRIDGVQSAKISDIEIYNLFEETKLGMDACGEYNTYYNGGNIAQRSPMQIGFSGNTLQGIVINAADNIKINDINIYSLQSHTGDAYGIAIWPSVNLMINGQVDINDIHAGWLIPEQYNILTSDTRPNRAPIACGISYINEYIEPDNGNVYVSNIKSDIINDMDDIFIHVENIYGFVYCDGSVDIKTMIGEYIGSDGTDAGKQLDSGAGTGAGGDVDDASTDSNLDTNAEGDLDTPFDTDGQTVSGGHIILGTIIACSILFCGFTTMGYIAYIYCQHKRQQKDTEARAKLLLEQAQQESLQQQQKQNIRLQTAEREQLNNYVSNYQSFPLLSPKSIPNNGIMEENENIVMEEQNERTPLIQKLPTFDRLNL